MRFLYRGFRGPLEFICLAHLHSSHIARSSEMLDIIMLAIGLAFFTVSIAYVYACDRL